MSPSTDALSLTPAKRRLFRILAVALSLLVCFLCLEIGLRLWGPKYYRFCNQSREYYSNPRDYFDVLRLEGNQPVYGIPLRQVILPPGMFPGPVESEGMLRLFDEMPSIRWMPEPQAGSPLDQERWIEEAVERWPTVRVPEAIQSPEVLTEFLSRKNSILAIGDSFTFGSGVRYEDIYLRRLERRLAAVRGPIRIKNSADLGDDLDDICDTYAAESELRQYPLVIYGFVLNDFGLAGSSDVVGSDYIDINNGGNEYSRWRGLFATFNFVAHSIETRRLDRVTRKRYLDAFKGDNARERFQQLGDLNGRIQADGSQLVIALFPLLYEFHDYPFQEIHDKIEDFCREEEIPLLDLLPAFSEYPAEQLWVHPTDHHPNEIAHKIAAEEIHAFLDRRGLIASLSAAGP